jgi:hypothetical protein
MSFNAADSQVQNDKAEVLCMIKKEPVQSF